MILSSVYLPSFAGIAVSTVGGGRGMRLYLAIIHNKTETSSNGLEWAEGVCRVSHPTE